MIEMIGVVGGDDNALATVAIQRPQGAVLPPPPPPSNRRGRLRVREVSSRFMSPLVASNTNRTPGPTTQAAAETTQRSKSVERPRQQQHQELLEPSSITNTLISLSRGDENVPEIARSLDSTTPLALALGSHGSHHHNSTKGAAAAASLISSSAHRNKKQQQQQQRAKASSKENDGGGCPAKSEMQQLRSSRGRASPSTSRPDTPIVTGADRDRIVPSRYRQSLHHPSATNFNTNGGGVGAAVTAAAQLLQEATSIAPLNSSASAAENIELYHDRARQQDSLCFKNNNNNWTRTLSDLRSSMPEVDVSSRWHAHAERSFNNELDMTSKSTASPCCRSLNFRAGDVTVASTTPPKTSSIKNHQVGSVCLPPHPSAQKLGLGGADSRKVRKLFNHQEDVHSLKLLYNHYLQWRFTNAKAEVSMLDKETETERQLYSLASKMLEMRDGVKRRSIELGLLQRTKTLSMIVESQMPYLDEWAAVEEDYSTSLSDVIDALLNLSLRLPISGGIKVDVTELGENLDSALKVIEMIAFRIQSFMVKAEELESLTFELAKVMGGERAHIQECGLILLKTYASQVEECSLRGNLIQLRGLNNCISKQEE